MVQAAIRVITIASLVTALVLSAAWWVDPGDRWLEPAGTLFALASAVSGIPAERWAAAAHRRARALAAVRRELAQNVRFFTDAAFAPGQQGPGSVYPRLKVAAVDMAFLGDVLDGPRDDALRNALLAWRAAAEDLNRRLDLTEVRLSVAQRLDPHELSALQGMVTDPGGLFLQGCGQLEALRRLMAEQEAHRLQRFRRLRRLAALVRRRLPGPGAPA